MITALVRAEVDGESLEEWEVFGFCTLLLIAGNETTTNLIGNGVATVVISRWEKEVTVETLNTNLGLASAAAPVTTVAIAQE